MSDKILTQANQYLTFSLDNEQYAIRVSKTREVLGFSTVTKVPRMPEFLRGVINLRGSVVPVADLKVKFNMPEVKADIDTSIVVTEVSLDAGNVIVGLLVDSVQEVIDLLPENIEPAPKIGTRLSTEFIEGIGKKNDDFIIILNIDRVFSFDEINTVREDGIAEEALVQE